MCARVNVKERGHHVSQIVRLRALFLTRKKKINNNYSKYCCMPSYRIIAENDVLTLMKYYTIVTS